MYDLILLATLALPVLAVMLAGRHFERGLLAASPEEQARRRYRLSWLVSLATVGQAIALWQAVYHFGPRMEITILVLDRALGATKWLAGHTTPWIATMMSTVLSMAVIVLYYAQFSLPWLRLDRIAKQAQGKAMRNAQFRMTLRGTLAGLGPLVLWFALVNALPGSFLNEPARLVVALAGFLLLIHSFSPLLVQLANPTVPLAADHPVAQMAMELGRAAGVRIEAVRIIEMGETKVANAMVSGLWSWLRRIYVTDHMLATFSVPEIRAILAHEVGHIRHRHLWWYLALALGGALLIPRMVGAMGQFEWLRDSALGFLIPFVLYWGVAFKFLSRRFERQADRFAVGATGDVATFQAALEKLAEVNGTVKKYSKWDIFQTHPPIAERVRALE